MNKSNIFLGLFILIVVVLGYLYYTLNHIDFMGEREPDAVEASFKRLNGILFSAEYRKGTDYCEVSLLDSINIEINVGDSYGGSILNKEYKIIKDTIEIMGGVTEIKKFKFSSKLFVQKDNVFYRLVENDIYDTTVSMKVKTNKIKL